MAYSWWQRVRLVSWLGLILAFTVIPPVVFPVTGLAQVQSSGVTVTPDQINALRYHANVFMGNANLESLPSETLRLKGPGTIEFWVSPLWDTPLDEDAYVLSCDAGGRTLYSVFFREEDEMLYLGFDCGDGDPKFAKLPIPVDDHNWHHFAITCSSDRSSRGTSIQMDGSRIIAVFPGVLFAPNPAATGSPLLSVGGMGNVDEKEPVGFLKGSIAGLKIWRTTLKSNTADLLKDLTESAIETTLLSPPHPNLANLVGYSDFADQRGLIKFYHPLAGFWLEQGAATRRMAAPNAIPLASQFRYEFPDTLYFEPFRDILHVYRNGQYIGVAQTTNQQVQLELNLSEQSRPIKMTLDLSSDGSVVCSRLPCDLCGQSEGTRLVLKRMTSTAAAKAWGDYKKLVKGVADEDYNFDKIVQHYTTVLKSFDITKMDPFNYAADRGIKYANKLVFRDAPASKDTNTLKVVPTMLDMHWIGETNVQEDMQFISSALETKASFSARLGFQIKVPVVEAFGASADFNQALENQEQRDLTTISRTGKNELFAVSLNAERAALSDDFKEDVRSLLTSIPGEGLQEQRKYLQFIENWGTHYCRAATIGALQIMTSNVERKEFVKSIAQDWNAEITFGKKDDKESKGNANAGGGQKNSQQWKEVMEKGTWSVRGLGGTSIPGGKGDSVNLDHQNTSPINVELCPLYELLSPNYFPGEPTIYLSVRDNLRRFTWDYIGGNTKFRPTPKQQPKTYEVLLEKMRFTYDRGALEKARNGFPLDGHFTLMSKIQSVDDEELEPEGDLYCPSLWGYSSDKPFEPFEDQDISIGAVRRYVGLDQAGLKVETRLTLGKSGVYTGCQMGHPTLDITPEQIAEIKPARLGKGTEYNFKFEADKTKSAYAEMKMRIRQVPDGLTRISVPETEDIMNPKIDKYMPAAKRPRIEATFPAGVDNLVTYYPFDRDTLDWVTGNLWHYDVTPQSGIIINRNGRDGKPINGAEPAEFAQDALKMNYHPAGFMPTAPVDSHNFTVQFDFYMRGDEMKNFIDQRSGEVDAARGFLLLAGTDVLGIGVNDQRLQIGGISLSGKALGMNRWHKVIIAVDGAKEQIRCVVDGKQMPWQKLEGISKKQMDRWYVSSDSGYYIRGMIDEFALFNRALTDAEMIRLASRPRRIGEPLTPYQTSGSKLTTRPLPPRSKMEDIRWPRDVVIADACLAYYPFYGPTRTEGGMADPMQFSGKFDGLIQDGAANLEGHDLNCSIFHNDEWIQYMDLKTFAFHLDWSETVGSKTQVALGKVPWLAIDLNHPATKVPSQVRISGFRSSITSPIEIPRRPGQEWSKLIVSMDADAGKLTVVANGKPTIIPIPKGFVFAPLTDDQGTLNSFKQPRTFFFKGQGSPALAFDPELNEFTKRQVTKAGMIDEVLVFNRPLSDSEIDLLSIRPRHDPNVIPPKPNTYESRIWTLFPGPRQRPTQARFYRLATETTYVEVPGSNTNATGQTRSKLRENITEYVVLENPITGNRDGYEMRMLAKGDQELARTLAAKQVTPGINPDARTP